MAMKKFVSRVALLLPLLGMVVSLNYAVDPGDLFHRGRDEKRIAQLLLSGANVANVLNYDDRLMQEYYVGGLAARRDVVVVGSSRAMQIGSGLFAGRSFFNSSVTGATLEDYIAIYELYRQRGFLPSTLVIGLDPWHLNRNNGLTRWKSLGREYAAAMDRLGLLTGAQMDPELELSLEQYAQLISPAYFQASLRTWLAHLREPGTPGQYYATDQAMADVAIRLCDGSRSFDREFSTMSAAEVRELAISYAEAPSVIGMDSFVGLDAHLRMELEVFVDAVQEDGVQVLFFLAPYHPEAYKRLVGSGRFEVIAEAQKYYEGLAARKRIKLLGSYDPAQCACSEDEFYDGLHPKASCIARILRGPNGIASTLAPR